jgi:glycosyltransferase involved in cell wall biosynthesis
MMKILQVNNYHYVKGGADRVYLNTTELLKNNGHSVINFSSVDPANYPSAYSDYFISLNDIRKKNVIGKITGIKQYLYNEETCRKLRAVIKTERPDVAHLHLFYGGLTASLLKILKEYSIPIVQTVHDYRLLCPANAFLNKDHKICEKCRNKNFLQCSINRCLDNNIFYSSILTLEAYMRKYMFNPLKYIDHFIFVSKFSQDKHVEFNSHFKNKSSFLYNFTFIPDKMTFCNNRNHVLFFGRLSHEKGILTLLEAIKQTNLILRIAGAGPLQNYVEEYANKYKNIIYVGYKSADELKNLINESSFIIVPSEWYENNPMTILEAFANGRPVIGSNTGGIPELIHNSKNGFLFESRNIRSLTETLYKVDAIKNEEYEKLSNNARAFAEKYFTADIHYLNLVNIYSKIMNS